MAPQRRQLKANARCVAKRLRAGAPGRKNSGPPGRKPRAAPMAGAGPIAEHQCIRQAGLVAAWLGCTGGLVIRAVRRRGLWRRGRVYTHASPPVFLAR